MNKYTKPILGLTLIELIVTVTIISVLAGMTLASINSMQRPQDSVDSATDFIENLLNQANTNSITANQVQEVCRYTVGTGSAGSFATCDPGSSNWINVNGNVNGTVLQKVTVTIAGATNNKVTYSMGLVTSNTNIAGKATITITSTIKPSCTSIIGIWPNGVLDITPTVEANC